MYYITNFSNVFIAQTNTNRTITLLVLGGIFLIIFLWIISSYNILVKYKNEVQESLSSIDIHLKLRFDLIPNLVSTVKGYTKHENEIFEKITQLRNISNKTQDEDKKIKMANKSIPMINSIIAIAEKYPSLKSDKLFRKLMNELINVEDKLVAARRFYNSSLNGYNTLISTFPKNMIAKLFKFKRLEPYSISINEKIISVD